MNIPGAGPARPERQRRPPRPSPRPPEAELDIHSARDQDDRAQAAVRARRQLDDAEQLFGARLAAVDGTGTAG